MEGGRTFVRLSCFMSQSEDPAAVELGRFLGRREAFAVVAGRCSAAEAESVRRIRDSKLYKQVEPSWEQFCSKHLGVSRRHIDRTLRLLDELGPAYFHVAQIAHVTPEEYRAIQAHVGEDGVRIDGAVVALLPENSEQVSAAVAELLSRETPKPARPAANSAEAILNKCEALAEALRALPASTPADQLRIGAALGAILRAAHSGGVFNVLRP